MCLNAKNARKYGLKVILLRLEWILTFIWKCWFSASGPWKDVYLLNCMFVKQVVGVKIEDRNVLYKTKKNYVFLE